MTVDRRLSPVPRLPTGESPAPGLTTGGLCCVVLDRWPLVYLPVQVGHVWIIFVACLPWPVQEALAGKVVELLGPEWKLSLGPALLWDQRLLDLCKY